MKVGKAGESLTRKGGDKRFFELPVFAETGTDAATGDIFEEDRYRVFFALTAEVLYNVWVLEMLHRVDFLVEGGDHFFHLIFILSCGFLVYFNLLDGQEISGR